MPDPDNWSDYPNIDDEVWHLLRTATWHDFFDAVERLPEHLSNIDPGWFYQEIDDLLQEHRVGYRFESGSLVRIGTQEFEEAVAEAFGALSDVRYDSVRQQFQKGLDFRNSKPPDWPNVIKEAVNSVEGVLQIIYGKPGVSLTTLISQQVPSDVPSGIKSMFKGLYGQGSGTEGARHAAVGGNTPTAARAELALHVAAALHAYSVAELDL